MRPVPPQIEFGRVLESLVRMKQYPTAISLYNQMKLNGIHPSLVT